MSGDMERAREAIAEARERVTEHRAVANAADAGIKLTQWSSAQPRDVEFTTAELRPLLDVVEAAAALVGRRLEQPGYADPWPWYLQVDWTSQPPAKCCIGCGGPYYESSGHAHDCPALALDAALAALGGAS